MVKIHTRNWDNGSLWLTHWKELKICRLQQHKKKIKMKQVAIKNIYLKVEYFNKYIRN